MNLLKFFFPFFKLGFFADGSDEQGGLLSTLSNPIGSALGAIGSIAGGIMGGNAAAEAYKRRLRAYNQMIQRADETRQAGEQAFYNNVNTTNPYLAVIGNDLRNKTNETLNAGRNQINAALAQQGVRGGQAVTQLARGIGNMTTDANRDINQMMYGDYANNKNLKAAYDQAKALAGTNAYLQQFQG